MNSSLLQIDKQPAVDQELRSVLLRVSHHFSPSRTQLTT